MTATTRALDVPVPTSRATRRTIWAPVISAARHIGARFRAFVAAGQLGSMPEREIGRRTGARG